MKLPYQQKPELTQSAGQIFDTLTAEQRQFVQTQKISGKHKIKHWLDLLEKLALWDEKADKKRVIMGKPGVSIFFAVVGAIAAVVGIFLKNYWVVLGGAGAFVLLLPLYFYLLARYQQMEMDLRNHFRLFVMPLLYVLREEAGEDAKLKMQLDFSYPDQAQYRVKSPPNKPKLPPYTTAAYFSINWLQAELELSDGTLLAVELNDYVRTRTRTRNARGKAKLKVKRKIKHSIKATLSFPKARYQPSDTPNKATRQDSDTHIVAQAKQKLVFYQNHLHQDLMPLLACLSECYKTVRPV